MADLVAELAARGRSLPPEERVRLLDLLLESLHDASSIDVVYGVDEVMSEAARIREEARAEDGTHCSLPLVIVDDLDVGGSIIGPNKAQAPVSLHLSLLIATGDS